MSETKKPRMFCFACGMQNDALGVCQNPRCKIGAPPVPAPARRLTDDEIEDFGSMLSRVRGRPLRVGERYWEVTDKDGRVVLRVEVDARELASFFASAPEMIARLLEHLAATEGER